MGDENIDYGDEDFDNTVEDSAFIDIVLPRPWLYDLDHMQYKKTKYKDNTWELVAEGMGWSGKYSILLSIPLQTNRVKKVMLWMKLLQTMN